MYVNQPCSEKSLKAQSDLLYRDDDNQNNLSLWVTLYTVFIQNYYWTSIRYECTNISNVNTAHQKWNWKCVCVGMYPGLAKSAM